MPAHDAKPIFTMPARRLTELDDAGPRFDGESPKSARKRRVAPRQSRRPLTMGMLIAYTTTAAKPASATPGQPSFKHATLLIWKRRQKGASRSQAHAQARHIYGASFPGWEMVRVAMRRATRGFIISAATICHFFTRRRHEVSTDTDAANIRYFSASFSR